MKKWIASAVLLWAITGNGMVYATPEHEHPDNSAGHTQGKIESETQGKRMVTIYNASGKEIGKAVVFQEGNGVRVEVKVSGLTPGQHGFHIHEKAFTDFDFKTSGDHLNPGQRQHGFDNPKGFHLGDMTNLEVKEDGTGENSFRIEGANLANNSPQSLLGRSIIIHAQPDDYKTDPAGNSGERIAGGNIQ
ncbi:superoxide dismutase family protein [Brevibacillus fluminis]|uniref:superoxide dismutase family protein n=1 Tax=Brevibacillus fluminis TaxID=511487 RepID=UPI003F8B360D